MTTDHSSLALTVSQLGELLQTGLRTIFSDSLWVEGQISNLHIARSGHAYFDLVEPSDEPGVAPIAVFNVALWRGARSEVERTLATAGGLALADDLLIRIRARLEFYSPRGRLQLIMEEVDPEFTLGRLTANRERLLRTLAEEGILDQNARLSVPLLPLRVGLITSVGSAAHADFRAELDRSGWAFTVLERDTRVQGEGVAAEIATGLRVLASHQPDLIALIRGGGSATELSAFDAEVIARTIANLPVPVLTGIGHEIDRSVADEVAHTPYKTPTACASAIVERAWIFANALETSRGRLLEQARRIIEHSKTKQGELAQRTSRTAKSLLTEQGAKLKGIASQLRALDPNQVLARGWSITRDEDGRLIRSATTVNLGDRITTWLKDGTVTSTVENKRQ